MCSFFLPSKEFDTTYGPAWHCIVGTSFGSYVTHSLGGFLYFSVDKAYILLFRTAVEPLSKP
uniref:Dynein light chain n=1 Tax=Aegilops tauschii subsp. strangulata TaxID=200361 RepID=A0A453C5C8_AEGTS